MCPAHHRYYPVSAKDSETSLRQARRSRWRSRKLGSNSGSAWVLPVWRAIELPGDRLPIPGQDSVGLGDASDLSERFAPQALADLRRGWHARDHSIAILRAASPSEYGSPRPDIHSAAAAPGSLNPSHTPAVAPTCYFSCRPISYSPSGQF